MQIVEIVLADVLTGKEHFGAFRRLVGGKRVAEGFDDGFCTQIASADANGNNIFARVAQLGCSGFNLVEQSVACGAWQVQPAQKVVTFARAFFKFLNSCFGSVLQRFDVGGAHCAENISIV